MLNIMLNIIFSLIVGWIIGWLIGSVVFKNNKQTHHGPNSKNIVGHVFEFNGKYYKFNPVVCPCPLLHG